MRVQNDVRVTIRVEKELKEQAERLFNRLGLNMSTALNIFLYKAVTEEGIPFVIGSNSAVFGSSQSSNDITNAFKIAVQNEISSKQQNGFPIARYDSEKRQAYLETPDGTREYING